MWYGSIQMVEEMMRDRQHDAARQALIAELRRAHPSTSRGRALRHALALGFAAISRSSAALVRRLDRCLADDLGRRLATLERG